MKLYAISGLGADKRVFDYLTVECELIPLDWIKPEKNESIENYALRLSKDIHTGDEFGILGVSFGGLVATEIGKLLNPKITFLISSAETKNELSPLIRTIGKTGLAKLIPSKMFDPPRKIARFFFGTQHKELLNNILNDTNWAFAKWAVNELVKWRNTERLERVVKICGTKDKLMPPQKGPGAIIMIEGGEHFMIVDRAEEISMIINERIRSTTS